MKVVCCCGNKSQPDFAPRPSTPSLDSLLSAQQTVIKAPKQASRSNQSLAESPPTFEQAFHGVYGSVLADTLHVDHNPSEKTHYQRLSSDFSDIDTTMPHTPPFAPRAHHTPSQAHETSVADLVWAGEFKSAEELGKQSVKDPCAVLQLCEVDVWRVVFSGDSELVVPCLDHTRRALAQIDAMCPSSPLFGSLSPEQCVLRDECHGLHAMGLLFRAGMEAMGGHYVKAPLTLRSSYKGFSGIPHDTPSPLALSLRTFGVGFFELFLTLAPPAGQLLFRLIGFHADRRRGLDLLRACEGPYQRWALLALCGYHLVSASQAHRRKQEIEVEIQNCRNILAFAQEHHHTKGLAFHWLQAETHKKENDYAAALSAILTVKQGVSELEHGVEAKPLYRLHFYTSQLFYVQQRYQDVVRELAPVVAPESTFSAKAFALLFVSGAHAMLRDDTTATTALQTLMLLPTKGPMDTMLAGRAEASLKRSHTRILALELLFFLPLVRNMRKDMVAALLPVARDVHGSCEEESEEGVASCLCLAVLQAYSGSRSDAIQGYDRVLALTALPFYRGVKDQYHAPFALYEKGILLLKQRDIEGAREAFKQCGKCEDNYSFSRGLQFRLRSAKKSIAVVGEDE